MTKGEKRASIFITLCIASSIGYMVKETIDLNATIGPKYQPNYATGQVVITKDISVFIMAYERMYISVNRSIRECRYLFNLKMLIAKDGCSQAMQFRKIKEYYYENRGGVN